MKAHATQPVVGHIGQYLLLREISSGGMGRIYEGWDEKLARKVAIKVLKPEAVSDVTATAKFVSEGRALARLSHPNVVRAYLFDQEDGINFIVMEYIQGQTLDEYLMSQALGLRSQIRLFTEILEGLKAAHDAGILHRDIKPTNVMIDQEKTAKLIDFGLAREHQAGTAEKTTGDLFWGTPNYVSPERYAGQPASVASDIYAAGVLLFYILAGPSKMKKAFPPQRRGEPGVALATLLNPILPQELKNIISIMTQKNPLSRYKSVSEIISELGEIDWESVHPAMLTDELRARALDHDRIMSLQKAANELGLDAQEVTMLVHAAGESGDVSTALEQVNLVKAEIMGARFDAAAIPAPKTSRRWAILYLVAGMSLATMWFLLRTPVKPAPEAPVVVAAQPSTLKAGQRFSFHYIIFGADGRTPVQNKRRDFTLSEITEDVLTFDDGHGQYEQFTNRLFPIGPSVTKQVRVHLSESSASFDWTCVAGRDLQAVRTPAGNFQALDVNCVGAPHGWDKFKYVPALGYWVVWETEKFKAELNGFTR